MPDSNQPPMAHPRVAAGVLFFDRAGRVLLVKPNYKDGWDIPGGYVEPDETPLEACQRELREELGISLGIRDLLVMDWAPSASEGDKVLFVFDGGVINEDDTACIRLGHDELERWSFKARSELPGLMPPRLQRRIDRAIDAHEKRTVAYLEHGARPTGLDHTADAWWTTEHVATFLGVSASTIRAYVAREQMPEPDLRTGHQRLWRPETIEHWHQHRPRKSSAART